jgi:hypothetical protein
LRGQRLAGPAGDVLDACAAALSGAVPSALFALAARVDGFAPAQLDAALADRRLLRVPAMRGSIYLMPVDLAAAGLGLSNAARILPTLRQGGVDAAGYEALAGKVEAALDDAMLTGAEINRALGEQGVSSGAMTLVFRLMAAQGRVVRAATRGGPTSQTFEYARADRWLGARLHVPPVDEALAAVAPWYLDAHGPATARDFAWWSGQRPEAAEAALAAVGARRLADGAYLTARGLDELAEPPPPERVRLLPHWDAYLMGHADRAGYLDDRWRHHVVDRRGNTANTVVDGAGRVVGVWDDAGASIRYHLFEDGPTRAEVAAAAERLAGVLGPRAVEPDAAPPDLAAGGQNAFQAPLTRRGPERRP